VVLIRSLAITCLGSCKKRFQNFRTISEKIIKWSNTALLDDERSINLNRQTSFVDVGHLFIAEENVANELLFIYVATINKSHNHKP
jgi:hypothetical protein